MKILALSGFLVVLGLAGILIAVILPVHLRESVDRTDYAVVLDAGSTATRGYVYHWRHKATNSLPFVSVVVDENDEPCTMKVHPGIASLAGNASSAGDYLKPFVEWAKSLVPEDAIARTPIFLRGTGGLRNLPNFEQGALIMASRIALNESAFYFEPTFADLLSGKQEAAYGFVSVNALYDRLGKPANTYGSLDLGGASSEIAFVSSHPPPANLSYSTEINGTRYQIYVQSNDSLGVNVARYLFNASLYMIFNNNSIVSSPCLPVGYSEFVTATLPNGTDVNFTLIGTSNAAICLSFVAKLVKSLTEELPHPLISSRTFIATDKYVKLKKFYKLKENANLLELQSKVSSFCSLNLYDAMDHHPDYAANIQEFCFMGMYTASLLRDFYGFSPSLRHILWKETAKGYPVTWTLGSLVEFLSQQTPDTIVRHHKTRFYHTAGGMVLLFVSILIVMVGLVLMTLHKRRRPEYSPVQS